MLCLLLLLLLLLLLSVPLPSPHVLCTPVVLCNLTTNSRPLTSLNGVQPRLMSHIHNLYISTQL